MNKFLLTLVAIFSFMQIAVQNCEASCMGGHDHQEMASDHSCCKGKNKVKNNCHSEYKSSNEHSCLHQFFNTDVVLETSKLEASVKEFSVKADLIAATSKKINLIANYKSKERNPDRLFQKFRSSFSIYLQQRKLLI